MDIICFSHLRWDFVYQRPQHLLSRFSNNHRVYFIEEPFYRCEANGLDVSRRQENLWVVTCNLQADYGDSKGAAEFEKLLAEFFSACQISQQVFWYYTPMALLYTGSFEPELVIYDCMDELSAFKFAPAELKDLEARLLEKADLVFTGGYSLFESKKNAAASVHLFPSSIDKAHFKKARDIIAIPQDQQGIPHPRIGFYGVLDERLDINLLSSIASLRPDWHFILIGPIVKIDEHTLPHAGNIHYLGQKNYDELPAYLAGWDIAMLCFAINESTRFISPTKTPEYLAAGKPVISTPIKDVIREYGVSGMISIVSSPEDFVKAAETMIDMPLPDSWQRRVDEYLSQKSWERTVADMQELIYQAFESKSLLKQKQRI